MSRNYSALGNKENVTKTVLISLTLTGLLLMFFITTLEFQIWPNFFLPIVSLITAARIFKLHQKKKVEGLVTKGASKHPTWLALPIGIVSLVITCALGFGATFVVESLQPKTKNFDTNAIEYSVRVDEAEVDMISDQLYQLEYWGHEDEGYLYLSKQGKEFILTFSILEEYEKDQELLDYFESLRRDLDALLPENSVVFKLATEDLSRPFKVFSDRSSSDR